VIGAGTIEISAQVSLSPGSGEPVHVSGQGRGETILHFTQTQFNGLVINGGDAPQSMLSDLTATIDGPSSMGRNAVAVTYATVSNVDFNVTSLNGSGTIGLDLSLGGTCLGCKFVVSGGGGTGSYTGNGNATFTRATYVHAPGPPDAAQAMVVSVDGFTVTANNATFSNFDNAISMDTGSIVLTDSLINMGAVDNAYGIYAANGNNSTATQNVGVDGVTVTGTGDNQRGVYVAATSVAGDSASAGVKSSLFWLTDPDSQDVVCQQANNGVATVGIQWSLIRSGTPSGSGSCLAATANNLLSDTHTPTFLNAAAGDFRLAPGSPVIDQGEPAASTLRTQDAALGARFVDGSDLESSGEIDIGGFEYQNYLPASPVLSATPNTVYVGESVAFGVSSSDENGQALTYQWNFDDGSPIADGASVDHVFTAPGVYQPKAFVSDGIASNADTTTVTVLAKPESPVVPSPSPPAAPTLALKKSPKAFKINGKGFVLTSAKAKAKLTVTSSVATTVTLSLAKAKGGYVSGKKCVKAKPKSGTLKRCDLPLGKAQKLAVDAGVSYVSFGGGKGGKNLPAGKYVVTIAASGVNDSPKSILNLIR
jgi:hypothetical protein